MKSSLRFLPLLLVVLVAAPRAHAQIAVSLATAKDEIIPYEAARCTVSISNRSARPVLLATATGSNDSWIRFTVTDERGNLVPMTGMIQATDPIQLRPGQSVERGVNLATLYPLTNYGKFTIKASVWCPPDRAYAVSNSARIQVVGAREIWSDSFGIPAGRPGAGTSRVYRLLQLRGMDGLKLYARVDDRDSGKVLVCYPIGTSIELRAPSATIDGDGNLHVLMQSAPDMSYHVIIDPNGKPVTKDAYRDGKGTVPSFATAANNSVQVSGGVLYDPIAEQVRMESVRRISERPEGLLRLLGKEKDKPKPGELPQAPANAPASNPNYQPLRSLEQP